MGPKGTQKKLLSYAFSEVSSNIHWSGVGTGENYYLSEVINLSNIHLSRFYCIWIFIFLITTGESIHSQMMRNKNFDI